MRGNQQRSEGCLQAKRWGTYRGSFCRVGGEFSDPLVFIPELPSQPKPSSGLVAASPCTLLLGCFLSSLLRKLVGRLNAHLHPDVWIALGYLPSAWGCAAHHCVKADVWSQASNHEGKPAFGWGSASMGARAVPGRAVFTPKATSLLRFGCLCLQNSPVSSLLRAGGAGGSSPRHPLGRSRVWVQVMPLFTRQGGC